MSRAKRFRRARARGSSVGDYLAELRDLGLGWTGGEGSLGPTLGAGV